MDPELSPWRRGPLSASSPSRDLSRAQRPDGGSGERATPLLGGPQAPPQRRQRPREPPHRCTASTSIHTTCGQQGPGPTQPLPLCGLAGVLQPGPLKPVSWAWPLTRVAQAAPRAGCVHVGLGSGAQESVGDRVLRDDVLHAGDVEQRQQHPQELHRRVGLVRAG